MGLVGNLARGAFRRSAFYFWYKALALVTSAATGWIGDLWWMVKPAAQESPFSKAKQAISYFAIMAASLWAVTNIGWHALPALVFMAAIITIHRVAAVGLGLPPKRFARVWTKKMTSPLHWLTLAGFGLIIPAGMGYLGAPGTKYVLWLAWALWLIVAHYVAHTAAKYHVEDRRLTATHGPSLAAVFRVSLAQFDHDSELHMVGDNLVIFPAPPAAAARRDDVESQLALVMPEWELDAEHSTHRKLTLKPTSLETGERRAALAESGGLLHASVTTAATDAPRTRTVKLPAGIDLGSVEGHAAFHAKVVAKVGPEWAIQEIVEGKAVLVKGAAAARPSESVWKLAPEMGEREAAVKAQARAERMGLSLVSWDFDRRRAVVANTLPVVRALRGRLADALRCMEHEVELNIAWAECGPATVTVLRAPRPNTDAHKRREFWLTEVPAIMGTPLGHLWTYAEDATTGAVQMGCTVDPLAKIVEYTENPSISVLPTDPWQVGVDEAGRPVEIDLANSAHLLVAGATRSGKSVATYGLLVHVLRMGDRARLLVADPNDTTIAPFEHLVSWGTSSTEPAPVTTMLQWVRQEMDRRKPILRKMRQDKVGEFTPELPLVVVVIDEAANYMRHSNGEAAKAMTTELLAVASQGAKYGIRVVLITQRPDSTILPTAIRSQLSARMSFRLEDLESAKMTFPDIEDPANLLSFSPGVGLIKEVAGKPRRFRSAYLDDHWGAADQIAAPMVKIDVNEDPAAYSVTDLGELDLGDLDDLDMTLDDTDAPSAASQLPSPEADLDPFSEAPSAPRPVKAALVIEDDRDFDAVPVVVKPKLVLPEIDLDDPFA